ncbi:vacuolar protein sorting-associated protein 13 family protein [Reticulomyxa filosa]|uniref:Vacuolar protein sorting-associated protein 13 family protein n=1 Tax=Reticulomyxa filosa TaxID=46433 RepID=X6PDX4_RETFI|nr:vacuolar protein sorting-associated protein 13 family protein [Reticulomyxa filosa]|eukprot:ETO36264.1 vacuolar protein sorting-associated protein 13 family protein [Reticulomyxa filosa]
MVGISIEFRGGQKVITLRSPAQFVNNTNHTITFLYEEVASGKSMWCPIKQFMEFFDLYIYIYIYMHIEYLRQKKKKKKNGSKLFLQYFFGNRELDFTWAPIISDENGVIDVHSVKAPLSTYEEDVSKTYEFDGNGITYSYVVHTYKEEERERIIYDVWPSVRVENLFPVKLELVSVQKKVSWKQELHPGQSQDMCFLPKSEFASVRLGNLEWHGPEPWSKILSKAAAMHEGKTNEKYVEDLVLVDLVAKEKLYARIECSQLGKGSHLLTKREREREKGRVFAFVVFLFVSNNNNNNNNNNNTVIDVNYLGKSIPGGMSSISQNDKKLQKEPVMFGIPNNRASGQIYVQTPYSKFSDPFAADAVGNYTRVDKLFGKKSENDVKTYEFEVGVEISLVTGIFRGLIKRITFAPRHFIRNNFEETIEIKQAPSNETEHEPIQLRPNESIAFHWVSPAKRKALQFRIVPGSEIAKAAKRKPTVEQKWSGFVRIGDLGSSVIRILRENSPIPDMLDIQTTNAFASLYINVNKADKEFPPLRVVNRTLTTEFRFCQKRSNIWETVQPLSEVAFAWHDLEGPKKILVQFAGAKEEQYKFDMRDVEKEYPNIGFMKNDMQLYCAVEAHGPTQALVISDFKIEKPENISQLKLRGFDLKSVLKKHKPTVEKRKQLIKSDLQNLSQQIQKLQETKTTKTAEVQQKHEIQLHLEVVEARGLASAKPFGKDSDPYVSVAVSNQKKQSPVKNHTCNPAWNFSCRFVLPENVNHVALEVFDKGLIHDDSLGKAVVSLEEAKKSDGDTVDRWVKLKKCIQIVSECCIAHFQNMCEIRLTGNKGDIHVRMAVAKSKTENYDYQIRIHEARKQVLEAVQQRLLEEIAKNDSIDESTLRPRRQQLHRIAIFDIDCEDDAAFDVLSNAFVILRVDKQARKIALGEDLFGESTIVDEDFYVEHKKETCKASVELWTSTKKEEVMIGYLLLKQDEENESKDGKVQILEGDSGISLTLKRKPKVQFNPASDAFKDQKYFIRYAWVHIKAADPSLRSNFNIQAHVPSFGVSVVDGHPTELLYISANKVDTKIHQSLEQTTLELVIDHFQIDTQRRSSRFCSLLAPFPQLPEKKKPFLQVSLNVANISDTSNLTVVQGFSALVQKMVFQLDEALIWDVFRFSQEFIEKSFRNEYNEEDIKNKILCDPTKYLEYHPGELQKFFFKIFHLQPLAIDVSFSVNPTSRPRLVAVNPMLWLAKNLINTLISMLGNVENVPMRLNSLLIEDAFGDKETLIDPIISHYRQQGLRECFKLVGSLNLLGNPVELIGNIGAGVKDFFYEPAQGLVDSPLAFTRGVGKGTSSLLSKTISGVFGAASKVTTSVSKATEVLTMDDDYQAQRRMQEAKGKPKHIGDGLARGVTSLTKNIFEGVTGVVTKPIEGAKKDGVLGVGKGLTQGVTGLVFKPVTGVIDLASNTLNGIANTATFIDMSKLPPIQRKRLPRFLRPGVPMQPFSTTHSLQQNILWDLEEKGLDHEQLRNVGTLELLDMREHERIIVGELIQNGELAVLASNLRIIVARIVKKTVIDEHTKDDTLENVERIVSAYFGVSDAQFSLTRQAISLSSSINVTELVAEHLNETEHVLDLKALKPMYIKLGDPAPQRRKVLYLFYVPSKSDESFTHGQEFLQTSRVLFDCETKDSSLILKYHNYEGDVSASDLLTGKTFKKLAQPMTLNVCCLKCTYMYICNAVVCSKNKMCLNFLLQLNSSKDYVIKCASEEEAKGLAIQFKDYVKDLNPDILSAKFGAGVQLLCLSFFPYLVDVSDKLRGFVKARRLSRLKRHDKNAAPDFVEKLLKKEKEDPLPGKEKNVYVKFATSYGCKSKMFKDKYSIILD